MVKRFFEILPGALAWATIVLMVLLSRFLPVWVSVFIILFDIYWLLKTMYLSLHLRATFSAMKKNMELDWLAKTSRIEAGHCMGRHLSPRDPSDVRRAVRGSARKFRAPCRGALSERKIDRGARDLRRARGGGAARRGSGSKKNLAGGFSASCLRSIRRTLPGEIPGKGSNETWAALRAKEEIIDPCESTYEHVLVSVFDVDTQVFPEYFGRLTYVFLTAENRLRAIYQPIPLFTNNVHEAPALARVVAFSTTFWQMMQQSRPERLTSFSSQSIPFQALLDIGFWQKDIVSEDSRIFWQCYLRYHGDFRVEPLFYPVSMDANVAPTFWQTMKNLYKQQRRWGWGCENIPYMLEGFRNDPAIPPAKKRYWTFNVIEGFHSWATNSLMIFALGLAAALSRRAALQLHAAFVQFAADHAIHYLAFHDRHRELGGSCAFFFCRRRPTRLPLVRLCHLCSPVGIHAAHAHRFRRVPRA